MKPAFQKDAALLADLAATPRTGDDLHLWWLGQSGFLVQFQGRRLLFDPYLSDSLTKKYTGTAKPHVRLTECCLDPAALCGLDVVTSSHNHTDPLDAETLGPLFDANPGLALVLPAANEDFARTRLGDKTPVLHGLDDKTPRDVAGFTFRGLAAAHNTIERDAQGRPHFLSFIVSFGPWTLFHSGDTLWHDHLPHLLIHHAPDLALLPINGYDPARGVAGNLNGTEAAALAKACGARLAIPHHFGTFEFNTADPAEFIHACERLAQPHRVLRPGEGLHLPPPA